MEVSWNRGICSHHSFLEGIFHDKPSSYGGTPIDGTPHIIYIYIRIYIYIYTYIYIYIRIYIYIFPVVWFPMVFLWPYAFRYSQPILHDLPMIFPSENHPTGGQFGGALHRPWSPCCTTAGDLRKSHALQSEHFCGFGHEDFRWDSG